MLPATESKTPTTDSSNKISAQTYAGGHSLPERSRQNGGLARTNFHSLPAINTQTARPNAVLETSQPKGVTQILDSFVQLNTFKKDLTQSLKLDSRHSDGGKGHEISSQSLTEDTSHTAKLKLGSADSSAIICNVDIQRKPVSELPQAPKIEANAADGLGSGFAQLEVPALLCQTVNIGDKFAAYREEYRVQHGSARDAVQRILMDRVTALACELAELQG